MYWVPLKQFTAGLRLMILQGKGYQYCTERGTLRSPNPGLPMTRAVEICPHLEFGGGCVMVTASGDDGGGCMDLAPARQGRTHWCRRREKRSRSNLFFERRPCGCVDRRSAGEPESSSDEKRTRIPHDASVAAHETLLLYLYYQPPRKPLPYFFSRRPPTTAKGSIKAEGRPRSSLSSPPPSLRSVHFPPFFSRFLSFPSSGMQGANIHTTFGAAFIGIMISSLYESNRPSITLS